jgi:hypothetical protein
MAQTGGQQAGGQQMTPQQANAIARNLMISQAVNMVQPINSQTISGTITTSNNVINIQPRMVGFLKRFYVEVSGTVTDTGTGAASIARTNFGSSNLLSNVTLTDLSNNVRHNTTGPHLHLISSAKRGRVYGASINQSATDSPVAFGSNYSINAAPATIPKTTGNTGVVKHLFEIPVCYSDTDFRGGIFLGVTGANMNLQLTVNAGSVTASGDQYGAIYTGDTGTLSNVTVTVYQNYLDQLPMGRNGYALPILDMSTIYQLLSTTQTGIVASQDFPIPYANFRSFLSTIAVLDEAGTFNSGSDVNYWALTAANFTNFWKIDPVIAALWVRQKIGMDVPPGVYYFDHRHRPINTNEFGNQELILNANSNLSSTATLFVLYEMMGLANMVAQSGSLVI